MPLPYTRCEQIGQDQRITEPTPRCTKQNRNKKKKNVKRMKTTRYPKMAMEGSVNGHQTQRTPRLHLDCISQDCKTRSITRLTEASRLATIYKQIHLAKGPFILHPNCVAVPMIDYFLPQVTAESPYFKFKMNLTFMRHRNAVISQFLCSRVQCGNAKQLRRSMNGP